MKLKELTRIRAIALSAALAALVPAAAFAMPWSWDMFTQPSHKAQEEPALSRPAGTEPFNKMPIRFKDRAEAAKFKNPADPAIESIERGKAKYTVYCATCHGDGGKGDGIVGQKYVAPTDLTGEYVQGKAAGDIFYTITYGGLAIMPAYGDSVPEEDRWHIVNYIKDAFSLKKGRADK